MGTLYLARDTSPNTYRLVALKLLNTNLDSDDLRDRFGREARALASLSHPNVVNIYECGEYRGSPYIVMEYVRGETLAEKIKRKAPLSLPDKLKLMMELCAGLAHAHEAGIIHRDIKPANLMIDHHGRLRLLDFGIARVVEGGVTMAGVHMTQINTRIGTPGYMSPEQYEGAEIDRRSDIFAVGAVFYELLAYREAFPGSTTRQIERKVLESEPERLTSQIRGLDPEIEALVSKALQKDPDKRFQDAIQMERALTKVWWRLGLAESVSAAPRPTPPPAPGSGKKSSRADAAYQRALVALQEGAPDTARRYAMEALAEDSKHDGARRFLEKIDPNFKPPPPSPPPPPPPLDQELLEPTIVSTRSELNLPAARRAPAPEPELELEQTIVSAPARKKTPAGKPSATGSSDQKQKKKNRIALPGSVWSTYGFAIAAIGVLVLVAGGVFIAMLMQGGSAGGDGHLLTVTKPSNGTVVGDGINCGSGGSDCSEEVTAQLVVELRLVPDDGFAEVGFTENCGVGRFRMNAARTCGATFVRLPSPPPSATAGDAAPGKHTLTILAMDGGVVRVGEVDCRASSKGCSVPLAAGTQVDLEAQADKGYTFENFTGDCDVDGRVVMNGPHTCGARFVPNAGGAGTAGAGGPGGRGIAEGPGPIPPVRGKPPVGGSPGTSGNQQKGSGPGAPGGAPGAAGPAGPGAAGAPGSGATPGAAGAAPGAAGAAPGVAGAPGAAGAPGGQSAPPPPGTPEAGQAPPPPPPAEAPEVVAKRDIMKVLELYRLANEARSYDGVREVWPGVHENVRKMLEDLSELQFKFEGEPKVEMKGPNQAVAQVGTKITEIRGRDKRARQTVATIVLSKVNAANRWVIMSVNHKLAG
jgi:serine/threonine protein kinase